MATHLTLESLIINKLQAYLNSSYYDNYGLVAPLICKIMSHSFLNLF